MNNKIEFSTNWNNKLQCKYFNTLRLSGRYEINQVYSVYLGSKMIGTAKCVSKIRHEKVADLPENICMLDTGYGKTETIRILKNMYKQTPNIETTPVYSYVFGYITQLPINDTQQLNLFL